MTRFLFILIFVFQNTLLLSQNFPYDKKIKLPKELTEASGLFLASADSLWWINDGGHPPELFLTNSSGDLLWKTIVPGALNRDWEDLTADTKGNIYIGDFGNNRNDRTDLCIYRYNPSSGALDSILFSYPGQFQFPPKPAYANFDMEAFCWFQDSLHLFSKNRINKGNYFTKYYVIPDQPGTYAAILKDSLHLKKRVVTAAAISPDGSQVALLAYNFKRFLGFIPQTPADIFFLTDFEGSRFFNGRVRRQKAARCFWPTQFEALDYLNNGYLWIASERTPLYRQKACLKRIK